MKKLLLVGALILGAVGVSHAAWGNKQWNLTVTTGTYMPIFTKYGYILQIKTSSGSSLSAGDYGVGYSTMPRAATGGANGAFTDIWGATATVIPPLQFQNNLSSGTALPGLWQAPTPDGVYIETDLYWIQSVEKSGGANQTMIIWSK